MTTQQTRALPADVYDALELSALVYGGIGSGCLSLDQTDDAAPAVPHCIIGHAMFLDGYRLGLDSEAVILPKKSPVVDALVAAFPGLACDRDEYQDFIVDVETVNDAKVSAIIERRAYANLTYGRVTWKQWCRTMGVTRGGN